MDPILAQKTQELYKKLTKARSAGTEISPDQIEAWMRRETKGKYGLADAQGYVSSISDSDAKNMGIALGQGATFNFGDEAAGVVSEDAQSAMRLRDKAYSSKHPYKSFGLKLGGAILSPAILAALAPEGVAGGAATGGAMLGRMAVAGAAGAGLAAAGSSEAETVPGRLKDAALPAVAGAFMGPVAGVAGKVVGGLTKKTLQAITQNADQAAVRNAGRLMPEGLEQQAARHEMLAPGSFIPAGASQEATAAASGVGASARAALPAEKTAREALDAVKAARDGLRVEYNALGKQAGPLKLDNDLRDLLHTVNEDVTGNSIGLDRLQRLRTYYRERAGRTTDSDDRDTFHNFVNGVTKWLEPKVQGLSELDSRYSFLSRTKENYEKLLSTIQSSNTSHGRNALYGGESGSIAGHLPAGTRGFASEMFNRLRPGKDLRAEAVARQLLQPADASQVAGLAASRQAAMAPRPPTPQGNLTVPMAGSNAILTLWDMLTKPLPNQLENQQAGQ